MHDRARNALGRSHAIAVGGRPRVIAHHADSEQRRSLQLLDQPVAGARPLVGVRRSGIQDVCAVRDKSLWVETRSLDRRAKPLRTLRPDGRLVAIELRDRGEQLHRVHARVGGSADRHVEPTVVDGMRSQPMPH